MKKKSIAVIFLILAAFSVSSAYSELIAPKSLVVYPGEEKKFDMVFANSLGRDLSNVTFEFDAPAAITKYEQMHSYKKLFWGFPLLGFNNDVGEQAFAWQISSPEMIAKAKRGEEFKIANSIKIPPVFPAQIKMTAKAYYSGKLIHSENISLDINLHRFDIDYRYNPETRMLALFFIIDNRGKEERKDIYIDFSINKGKKSYFTEIYGPYTLKANAPMIMAQEYNVKLDKGKYELDAVLELDDVTYQQKKAIKVE